MRTIQLVLAVLLAACGGETGGGPGGPAPLPDGGSPTADGVPAKSCEPACAPPKVCGSSGVCLDPGACVLDRDCVAPNVCDPKTGLCVPADQCGSEEIGIDLVAPNLLVVLDRSCSMKKTVGTQTKWQIAVAALNKLAASYQGLVRFGLTLFPDTVGDSCTQSKIPVPVAAGAEATIQTLLTASLKTADANFPDGPCVTNIDTAMQQAASEPALADATRASYVLLLTDGQQAGCSAAGGDAGTTQIIKDLLAKKKVSTFVVGFGSAADLAQLNVFADAGGKPSSGATHFYKAEDQASLDAALKTVSKQATSCVIQLKKVPADLQSLHVYFDKVVVPQDKTHQQGWDYDPASNKLTFFGKPCSDIEQSLVGDLRILYGCGKPTEPPGPKTCASGSDCTVKEDCPAKMACLAGCCVNVIE
jgi:hypothetical protein